jgi:hypothetical protein
MIRASENSPPRPRRKMRSSASKLGRNVPASRTVDRLDDRRDKINDIRLQPFASPVRSRPEIFRSKKITKISSVMFSSTQVFRVTSHRFSCSTSVKRPTMKGNKQMNSSAIRKIALTLSVGGWQSCTRAKSVGRLCRRAPPDSLPGHRI